MAQLLDTTYNLLYLHLWDYQWAVFRKSAVENSYSVNDFIDIDNFRMHYLLDVVSHFKQLGMGTLLAELDLEDAFKFIVTSSVGGLASSRLNIHII